MAKARPDYGLDAPGVQLWLATAGIAALFAALLADMGWVRVPHFALARSLAWPGAFLLGTAAVMFWSPKWSTANEKVCCASVMVLRMRTRPTAMRPRPEVKISYEMRCAR